MSGRRKACHRLRSPPGSSSTTGRWRPGRSASRGRAGPSHRGALRRQDRLSCTAPNFVCPPAWWAATVVTVHDLTPPGSRDVPAAAVPTPMVRRALGRGAWVHTHTKSVAQEVVESLGARPDRVRVVHPGVWPPGSAVPRDVPGGAAAPSALLPDWGDPVRAGRRDRGTEERSAVSGAGLWHVRKGYPLGVGPCGPDGWGERPAGKPSPPVLPATRWSASVGRRTGSRPPHGGSDRVCLPLALRGLRAAAAPGHGCRRTRCRDTLRLDRRGARRRRPGWSTSATSTRSLRPSRNCSATRRPGSNWCGAAGNVPPSTPGRRARPAFPPSTTTPTAPNEPSKPRATWGARLHGTEEIRRRVGEVTWHHSIDLGHEIVTPGASNVEPLSEEELPNFAGRSVLDIGAWDGFYSFRAEKAGAARVVALDHYAWV